MTTESSVRQHSVLILETDDLIRELVTRWVTEAGHAVVAEDARAGDVSLVIVDVPYPARAEAALRQLEARYRAPVLAMSGRFRHGPAASGGVARRLGLAAVLPKPFTCEELLSAVTQCLRSR